MGFLLYVHENRSVHEELEGDTYPDTLIATFPVYDWRGEHTRSEAAFVKDGRIYVGALRPDGTILHGFDRMSHVEAIQDAAIRAGWDSCFDGPLPA
ncbi:MAG: hypothetical protein KatS3mg015_2495 [Fimbriimonadales bacterium]|nr:MAG: hypothetical protein KatS3mg015_2495 [Fimbriimonadales bacterium]